MKINTTLIRSGYDGKRCFVHARFCETPEYLIATSQPLDVSGCDLFDGIYSSKSYDGGRTWTEFAPEEGLVPTVEGEYTVVGCDGTPMYHKKTGKVIITGHTAQYDKDKRLPKDRKRSTWYSVYDDEKGCFSKIRFVKMPDGIPDSGNGCGQLAEVRLWRRSGCSRWGARGMGVIMRFIFLLLRRNEETRVKMITKSRYG